MKAVYLSLLPLLLGNLLDDICKFLVHPLGQLEAVEGVHDECADPKHGGRRVAAMEVPKCSAAICGAFCAVDCIPSVRFLRGPSCFAAGRFHSRLYCGSGNFHTCVLRADVLAESACVQRKRKAEITRGSLRSRAG